MMRRLAQFIVRFHAVIFWMFIVLACVCAVAMTNVSINRDMTRYLPEEFEMSEGKQVMAAEFGDQSLFNVMVGGVPPEKREKLADVFADIDWVTGVGYTLDDAACNSGEYALYAVNASIDSYSEDAHRLAEAIEGLCASRGYECWIDNEGLDSAANGLGPVLVVAVIIAMVILFILASSWVEPVLLLFTILVAVAINMGTNVMFESISETTNAIGAILQMALSMDYLIMLLNRYRRERDGGLEPREAMVEAITGGMTAIASSSVTTIAGLLCMVLMSFSIGRDLGLVLAKGVFLSLVCAFSVMPALVLWCEDLMRRTAKPTIRPQMRRLSAFSYKARRVLVVAFVVVFAIGFASRGMAMASFMTVSKNPDRATIEQVFDLDSQIVVLYSADAHDDIAKIVARVEKLAGVTGVTSLETGIGQARTARKMAAENDMDASLLRVLYYDYFNRGQTGALSAGELSGWLDGGMARFLGSDNVDADQQEKLSQLAELVRGKLGAGSFLANVAAGVLGIDDSRLKLVYLSYFAEHAYDDTWKMSTVELMDFVVDKVLDDPAFSDVIDHKTAQQMRDAHEQLATAVLSFRAQGHERFIVNVGFEAETPQMAGLVSQLRGVLDESPLSGGYYLIGQGPMVQEMSASFDREFDFLTIVTIVAILLIVFVTFRNPLIAVILVALIQSAFCWDLLLSMLVGNSIYYVALFCVQSILMGATIDYAILFTTNYREARAQHDVRDALGEAYRNSIRTISMSGSILVFACLCLGVAVEGITGQICLVISEGATAAVILVLLVLPGTLAALDRLVIPARLNGKGRRT